MSRVFSVAVRQCSTCLQAGQFGAEQQQNPLPSSAALLEIKEAEFSIPFPCS